MNVTVNGHLVADPADIVLEAEDKLEMPTYRRYRHSLGIWTEDDDDDEDEEEASSSGDGGDKEASPHKSKASPSQSKDKSKQKPRHPDSIPNTPPVILANKGPKTASRLGPAWASLACPAGWCPSTPPCPHRPVLPSPTHGIPPGTGPPL